VHNKPGAFRRVRDPGGIHRITFDPIEIEMREFPGRLLRAPVKRANAKATPGNARAVSEPMPPVAPMTSTMLSFAMRLSRTYQKPLDRTRDTSSKIRTRRQSISLPPVMSRRSRGMNGRSMTLIRSSEPRQTSCTLRGGNTLPGRSCLRRSKTPGKDSFLHMQSILGFVEHDGLRTVDHIVGDFLAAMGRQAMHEDRVLARGAISFALTW